MYFIRCCSIANTVISLNAHKLHQIHMNNQEKFTTRSSKLKLHIVNSQTVSWYPVRYSADILFSSLVSFAFCLLIFLLFFKINKIFILIQIRLCKRVSDKNFFTSQFPESRITFFWPNFFVWGYIFIEHHCVKSVCIWSFRSAFFSHFPTFGLNTERYAVSLSIQSECEKIREKCGPE